MERLTVYCRFMSRNESSWAHLNCAHKCLMALSLSWTCLLFIVIFVNGTELTLHLYAGLLQYRIFTCKCQGSCLTRCWSAVVAKQWKYNLLPLWPEVGCYEVNLLDLATKRGGKLQSAKHMCCSIKCTTLERLWPSQLLIGAVVLLSSLPS